MTDRHFLRSLFLTLSVRMCVWEFMRMRAERIKWPVTAGNGGLCYLLVTAASAPFLPRNISAGGHSPDPYAGVRTPSAKSSAMPSDKMMLFDLLYRATPSLTRGRSRENRQCKLGTATVDLASLLRKRSIESQEIDGQQCKLGVGTNEMQHNIILFIIKPRTQKG